MSPSILIEYTGLDDEEIFWTLGDADNKIDESLFPTSYPITHEQTDIKIPTPIKKGCRFNGWIEDDDDYNHKVIYIKDDLIDIKGDYTTYSYTWGDLRYVYEPRIFDKKAKPYFSEGYGTVTFDPNGGTINGRDEWVIEIDYDYDNDQYNFDLADYVPEREG